MADLASLSLAVSICLLNLSPVFVAGHQIDSPAAPPTDSGFRVCKINGRAYN